MAMAPQSMKKKAATASDVERGHGDGGDPVELAVGGLAAIDFGHRNHVAMNSIKRPASAL